MYAYAIYRFAITLYAKYIAKFIACLMPMTIPQAFSAQDATTNGPGQNTDNGGSDLSNNAVDRDMDYSMEEHESCVLCEMTGSNHAIVDEVNTYILDNLGRVHISEMAEQVTQAMNELPNKYLSKEMFYKHIRSHMRQQKVVLSNLLNDLLEVAQNTKHACVCVCSDTDTRVVDPKMLQAYLKTVDSIMAIYRSDAMKERRE